VRWLAQQHGIAFEMPATHPFNPLGLLRLAIAAGPNRRVVEAVFRHVWLGGADAADPARLALLAQQLAPADDPKGEDVKLALRQATQDALAGGVFGVPTLVLDGVNYWGLDALPMVAEALHRGD
jgi:2-hydroxychromene-2-carboxylate isomerase